MKVARRGNFQNVTRAGGAKSNRSRSVLNYIELIACSRHSLNPRTFDRSNKFYKPLYFQRPRPSRPSIYSPFYRVLSRARVA